MPSSDFYIRHYGAMADGAHQQRYVAAQKGNGFFGRLIRGSLIPIVKSVLPYLKNVALDGVGGLVDDLKEGKSFKDATTGQLKRASDTVLTDMVKRVKTQSGSGIKKRKRGHRGAGLTKASSRKRGKRTRQSKPIFKV